MLYLHKYFYNLTPESSRLYYKNIINATIENMYIHIGIIQCVDSIFDRGNYED